MSNHKKSQSAIEYILLVAAVIIVVFVFLNNSNFKTWFSNFFHDSIVTPINNMVNSVDIHE